MDNYSIINLREHPRMKTEAAEWFHEKWDIPADEYLGSMELCIDRQDGVPQWYIVMDGMRIIGGAGVIDNDFHLRKDLSPNVCALYVECEYRRRGIAGKLLEHVCRDMWRMQASTLYLVTEHTAFYERYGWSFLCMVCEEGGGMIRMYKREPDMTHEDKQPDKP